MISYKELSMRAVKRLNGRLLTEPLPASSSVDPSRIKEIKGYVPKTISVKTKYGIIKKAI